MDILQAAMVQVGQHIWMWAALGALIVLVTGYFMLADRL